jgi:5-methylcytosine-specific restriction endonuclease McrA
MAYKYREDLYKAQKRHRIRIRGQILDFLSTKECVDCGEKDPVVLEFDHKDPDVKFKPISKMLSGHYGWDTITIELNKCEIRCANCHRRKTYLEQGSFGRTIKPL